MSSYIGEIRIGKDYQATLPSYLGPYPTVTDASSASFDQQPEGDLSNANNNNFANFPPAPPPEHGAVMVWNPKSITDDNLIMFLRAARSVTAFAGMCRKKGPNKEDGASVVSRDDTTQRYFDVLHENEYDVNLTLDILGKDPLPKMWEKEWTHEEAKCFSRAIKIIGKEFPRVRDEYLKHKRTKDLIQFYYFWKKSPYNPSRNQRRNRRNRKCAVNNAPTGSNSNGVSSNQNPSKSSSNSKGGSAPRPTNPLTDQIKVEDGGSTNKALETLTVESSLPQTIESAPSPGRINGHDHEPAKSSAAPTTTDDTDNLFDNDDIPLLNLVKVARGLAIPGPAPNQDKSGSVAPKDFAPKEFVENSTMDSAPPEIKIGSLTVEGTSIDSILPEAIVLDEGIAAPRITLATTSTSSCNNLGEDLYEIPLSDIGTIKSEIQPVQSSLEAKLDGAEKFYEDLLKSPVPLKIVTSHSVDLSEATVKSPRSSPVRNRTSTPEPFVPVRSSVLIPTPPSLIKTLKPDANKRGEQSASPSPEIGEAETATTNALREAEQWLGEKLFRNGNMYVNIKRADGLSCARTDLAFVYQKLPFHYPADAELSQLNGCTIALTEDLSLNTTMQSAAMTSSSHHDTNYNATTGTTTTSTASTTTATPSGPFAAKMNRSSKAPAAVASIIPIPCPPKSRPSREDEFDRGAGLGVMGGPFAHHPTHSAPSYWYGQTQQPFLLTPPPLHLAQASAALLPYFMAAASGAFAPPPFPLPSPLVPLNFEPEGVAGIKASTPVFPKGPVGRGDHQQQKNQRAQEPSHDYTRSSAVKNGFSTETTSPALFRGPFSSNDPFEALSPYYPYFSSQQPQQRSSKSNAMGMVKSVASPPHHPPFPYPPHSSGGYPHLRAGTHKSIPKVVHPPSASGPAPFTPWANRPAPHPGVYEYPPGNVKDLSCPVVGSKRKSAQDSTFERKKTPAPDAKTAPSRKQPTHSAAYFPKFPSPYNELAFNHSLGMGSNQDSPAHQSLTAHYPSLTNGGTGLSGKTPPGNRSKMVTSATTANAPFTSHALLDPFYHHRGAAHQQHYQAGAAAQARLSGPPFEFNPFLTGPAPSMVSSNGPGSTNPYHHLSPQNYHPSLMRAFRGVNFNPFPPPIPEEIMAAAVAQHQYQLLQQHSYFPNPFSPNLLPSVLQQQDRNDMKRE